MARTNIELDEKLTPKGLKLKRLRTKKELVAKKKRKRLLKLEGRVEWTGSLSQMRKSRT